MRVNTHLAWESVLHNPAIPAAVYLFGMIFFLAFANFSGLPWTFYATAILYVSLTLWVALIAWQRRDAFRSFASIDMLFLGFVIVLLASMSYPHGDAYGTVRKEVCYLPFLVCAPYFCGRLIGTHEVEVLSKVAIYSGMVMLPLMAIDLLISPSSLAGRWPFFGLNYSPLLLGGLFAVTLISLGTQVLSCSGEMRRSHYQWLLYYIVIGLVTVLLVWVKARGWVFAGLAGVSVAIWVARNTGLLIRLGLFMYVLCLVALALSSETASGSRFYGKLLIAPDAMLLNLEHPDATHPDATHPDATHPDATHSDATHSDATHPDSGLRINPILGEASCRPIEEGINSAAIRGVLYQEAYAIFMENPLFGIGATRFGERSCIGRGGFPHSTVLQGFAELGLIGGGLLLGVLSTAIITLVRRCILKPRGEAGFEARFVLALFSALLLADQIYGNYFMMVGACLMLGITARMQSEEKKERAVNG